MPAAYCFRILGSVICITYSCSFFARKMLINLISYRCTKACHPARRHVSARTRYRHRITEKFMLEGGLWIIQSNLLLKAGLALHL